MTDSKAEAAAEVLRGVCEIAENEMLVRQTYITEGITNEALAEAGAVCGGRQACLVGAVALAATDSYAEADALIHEILRVEGDWQDRLSNEAAEAALEALDAEAIDRLSPLPGAAAKAALGWPHEAEGYFETYLEGTSYAETRKAVIELATAAIQRLA